MPSAAGRPHGPPPPPAPVGRTSNKKRPRLTPAYIQRERPGRAAPRAHPPAAAHDFQRDRHARRGEGRPRRAHGLAAAPALAHAQPRDQVHQGKAVPGRYLEAPSGGLQRPEGPEVACHPRASAGTTVRASEVPPRLEEHLPEPVPTRRQRGGRRQPRTVVTTSGLVGEVMSLKADLSLVLGVPWVSSGRAGVRFWGSLDTPRLGSGVPRISELTGVRFCDPPSFLKADGGVPVLRSARSPQQARVRFGGWFPWVSSEHTGVRFSRAQSRLRFPARVALQPSVAPPSSGSRLRRCPGPASLRAGSLKWSSGPGSHRFRRNLAKSQ
ncbi:hypothetical protein NN561_016515 [Cricetulus griseus]